MVFAYMFKVVYHEQMYHFEPERAAARQDRRGEMAFFLNVVRARDLFQLVYVHLDKKQPLVYKVFFTSAAAFKEFFVIYDTLEVGREASKIK